MTKDPFSPELRNKFAKLARDFAVRVPLTDLMGEIQSHKNERKRRIAAVNRRWSFTNSPSGWPVFTGVTSMLVMVGVGYLIYRCCRAGCRGPVSMAIARAVPKGAARDIRQAAARVRDLDMTEMGEHPCPASGAEATTVAVLAIVLLILVLAVAVLVWKKRKAILRSTTDGVYIQFATPTHQEVVLLGEVTVPVHHLFLEGSVLLKDATMTQVWMKYILTIQWPDTLKGAANRPGMHPVTIPLPNTIEISKRLAGLMLGASKYSTKVRLLKYNSGLATPIPANMPRLVDSRWSTLGKEPPATRGMVETRRVRKEEPSTARPRPSSMENIAMDRRGTGAVYVPLC